MKIENFPICCGAKILCDFGHTVLSQNIFHPSEKEINTFIQKSCYDFGNKILFAVINREQYPKIAPALKKYGFKQKGRYFHDVHNSYIYCFIRAPDESSPSDCPYLYG